MGTKQRWIELARRAALNSPDDCYRLGAVLVRGKTVIRSAWNQGMKTHPVQARLYPERDYKGLHAEMALLRGFRPYDVAGSDVYLARVLRNGFPAFSFPCRKCFERLFFYGIRRVYFSTGSSDSFGCAKVSKLGII